MKGLEDKLETALDECLRKRSTLILEACIAYLLAAISVEDSARVLREHAQYLEDHN